MRCDAALHRGNQAVDNEEASVHDFAKLLEGLDGQLYEEIHHLVRDFIASEAHKEGLQGTAPIVEENCTLTFIQICLEILVIVELCDLSIDQLTDLEEFLLQTLAVTLLQHIVDIVGEGLEGATF